MRFIRAQDAKYVPVVMELVADIETDLTKELIEKWLTMHINQPYICVILVCPDEGDPQGVLVAYGDPAREGEVLLYLMKIGTELGLDAGERALELVENWARSINATHIVFITTHVENTRLFVQKYDYDLHAVTMRKELVDVPT